MGADLLYADRLTDGWTDMTKLTVAFRNFTRAPTNALVKYKFLFYAHFLVYTTTALKSGPHHICICNL